MNFRSRLVSRDPHSWRQTSRSFIHVSRSVVEDRLASRSSVFKKVATGLPGPNEPWFGCHNIVLLFAGNDLSRYTCSYGIMLVTLSCHNMFLSLLSIRVRVPSSDFTFDTVNYHIWLSFAVTPSPHSPPNLDAMLFI